MQCNLERKHAHYNYMETIARTFIIPSRQNLGLGWKKNYFFRYKFSLSPLVTTLKTMQFNEKFPALPMEDIQNDYVLVIDFTSLQDAAEQLHQPELSAQRLRLELFFQIALEQVAEVLVLGKRLSNIQIDKFGIFVRKSLNFFDF